MTPDDMPWIGPRVLQAPTWLTRVNALADPDEPVPFAELVGRFSALEHLDAALDKDTPITEQIETLVRAQSSLRSLELGQAREGVRTEPLAALPLDRLGCSARLLAAAAGPWSAGLKGIPNLKIYARETAAISGAKPWEALGACETLELRRVELDARTLAAIATLPALRRLTLSMCTITPGAVAALGAAPALERLTILGQVISAADAAALAKAPKLRALVSAVAKEEDVQALRSIADAGVPLGLVILPRHEVTDGLIASICGELPGLSGLRLAQARYSKLTPEGLAQLGGLPELRWLDLSRTLVRKLKTAQLGFLSELAQLRSLSLREMGKISAAVITSLTGMTELRSLDLRGIPISDAAAKKLGKLDLRRLAISEAKIGPKGMGSLATLKNLKTLSIDHAKGFSDAMLAALAPAPSLERLDLKTGISADVYPSDLEPLAELSELRSLGVAEVGYSDAWMESLSSAPLLESLRFTRSDFCFSSGTVTEKAVRAGCSAPALRTIAHWSYVPDEAMQALIESSKSGAWTPSDYRSVEFEGPDEAPIEP